MLNGLRISTLSHNPNPTHTTMNDRSITIRLEPIASVLPGHDCPEIGPEDAHVLKASVSYSCGGMNYTTYKDEPRGYYLRFRPVVISRSAHALCERFDMFSGLRWCLRGATRFSAKTLRDIAATVDCTPIFQEVRAAAIEKAGLVMAEEPAAATAQPEHSGNNATPDAPSDAPTPKERIDAGLSALRSIEHFMHPQQQVVVADLIRTSEERDFFIDKIIHIAERIANMPSTYGQDGLGEQALAFLHYFNANSDWWLTEKDRGDGEDPAPCAQHQAFGMVILNGWEPECGYISLPELFSIAGLGRTVELDFGFEPTPIAEIKAQHFAANDDPPPPDPAPDNVVPFAAKPKADPAAIFQCLNL